VKQVTYICVNLLYKESVIMEKNQHINKMLLDIQEEFRQEFGYELSLEQIALAIDCQFETGYESLAKGEGMKFPYIGKVVTKEFKKKPTKVRMANTIERRKVEALNINPISMKLGNLTVLRTGT